MIRFLLNKELRVEQQLDPNMTVLNYLRDERSKTGTKEGCASGDCGACTVVLGELDGDRIRYKSINACLTFIATLNGKQLISVEDLKQGSTLHPAQQAMVDCHGSQCGFCTPGIVMSMFALGKNITHPNKEEINEALAGNLCRCTGYRPIIEAAEKMANDVTPDSFTSEEAATVAKLRQIQPQQQVELSDGTKRAFNPTTIAELADLLTAYPNARLLAGGTDLALEVTQFHRPIETLIYIADIPALKEIHITDQQLELGASASLSNCYQRLNYDYPDVGALLHRFASLQIRNQGTLGGNIGNASPIGDAPPMLIALDAKLVLRKGEQQRTLDLQDYFIDYKVTAQQPGEFIEKVIVPRAADNGEFRSYKISKRIDDDISAVLGCFNLKISNGVVESARIAFGGMAAIPKRASYCEQALIGAPWTRTSIEQAKAALQQDFNPISDFRASREYRLLVATNMLTRYFIEIETPDVETRVTAYV
ncbi:xanthine dehydrogenase small subunit [Amphritea sp.]|uniref:xanthine dehydrogenase small subunit n=1 Tax=Amphritea sp. TaxID=1872502 RepID=UPI003A91E20E